MLTKLASHNADIQRLVDKGYAVRIDGPHLVVRDIPYLDANRQLQSLHGRQRAQATALQIDVNARHLSRDFFWSVEKGRDRFQLLIDQGLVVKTGPTTYQLANWEDFRGR